MKYKLAGDEFMHRGCLVRLSAYIMELARNHLMRLKNIMAKEFGPDCIVYTDTDSIVLSFDKIDPVTDSLVQ